MPLAGKPFRVRRELHGRGKYGLTRQLTRPLLRRVIDDDAVFIHQCRHLQPWLMRPRRDILCQQYRLTPLDLPRTSPGQSLTGGGSLSLHVFQVTGKIVGKVELVIEPRGGEPENQDEQWGVVTNRRRKAHGLL